MIAGIELAKACALAADENKAEDIKVLDVSGLSPITDFIVICSGTSMPHLKAIMRDIGKDVQQKLNEQPHSSDGNPDARWIVLDYVNVMVHVMLEDMRTLYALEDLWENAVTVDWES
ncbi:MAG: ribosome silencing factor [Rubritalea sp.]|jgi:ribosome-associated protein|tara:strand:+ start:1119 stop:1469 length:351 start_codon:yes stop_codon:yes gene_type:complete